MSTEQPDEQSSIGIMDAWALVKAGKIEGGWRRWTTADGREFPWHDLDSRRTALIEAAEHIASL